MWLSRKRIMLLEQEIGVDPDFGRTRQAKFSTDRQWSTVAKSQNGDG